LLGWVWLNLMTFDVLKCQSLLIFFWRIVAKDIFSCLKQVEKWGFSTSGKSCDYFN
jgi:hypothetical protein